MAKVAIVEDEFGYTTQPVTNEQQVVKRFTFSSENGLSVQVITYGATITSIQCPDKYGNVADVVLGFDDIAGYHHPSNPYFGAAVGRVCNRINKGQFKVNGIAYQVAKNWNGIHHLHGGNIGFDKFNWSAYRTGSKVVMTHVNPANFEGYPGAVIANASFELKSDNTFSIIFTATVSEPTPINLTNHSYFNLAGHDTSHTELYNHVVTLNADKITVTDQDSIPTGAFQSVSGTEYDLRIPKKLGESLAKLSAIGYDDNFCVTRGQNQTLAFVAHVSHPKSGRTLEVYSDQPGVQFYTSNFMPDPTNTIYPEGKDRSSAAPSKATEPIFGKNKALYFKHGAFCLETQNYPDAVNHSNFPNVIVNPGEVYKHEVVYKLDVEHEPIIEMVPLNN